METRKSGAVQIVMVIGQIQIEREKLREVITASRIKVPSVIQAVSGPVCRNGESSSKPGSAAHIESALVLR